MQCVAFYSNLPWFGLTNVIIWKSQCNAENACGNGMCKCTLMNHRRKIVEKNSQSMLHNTFLELFKLLETNGISLDPASE
jgi:hypothetical protein